MGRDTPRLPGIMSGVRRRRGRNELVVDRLAAHLRSLDQMDPHADAIVVLARTTGAALDRLEADPDRSEHVVGSVARVHLTALGALTPIGGAGDGLEDLVGALAAAVRDPAPA